MHVTAQRSGARSYQGRVLSR